MGSRVFVDTNVLVYLHDASDSEKRDRARAVMLNDELDLVISTQVLNEFFVTVTRKIAEPLSFDDAAKALEALAELEVVPVTRNLVLDALATGRSHHLSHWDALILEAASRAGVAQLFTEDLNAGSTLRGVEIVDPFAPPAE